MNVVISYSSVDKPFALKLARALKRVGVTAFLDEAPEIAGGLSFPRSLGDALLECRVLCLCLSQAFVNSPWLSRKVDSFRRFNTDCTILPCLLETVSPPPLLVDFRCADFSISFTAGFNVLLSTVELQKEVVRQKLAEMRKKWFDNLLPPKYQKEFLRDFGLNGAVYALEYQPNWYRELVCHQIIENRSEDHSAPHYFLTDLGKLFYAHLDASR